MRFRICCVILALMASFAVRAQPEELPACNPTQVMRAVSAAEELLNSAQGNLRALRCVALIDQRADENATVLPKDIQRRLAVIASNAIQLANGSATVGTAGGYNAQAAHLWLRFVRAGQLNTDDRRTAVMRLIEHGRYDGFEDYVPAINELAVSLGRELPPGFTLLLSSTLYRCPQWTRPQASNTVKPDEVPCDRACAEVARAMLRTASTILDNLSPTQRRGTEVQKFADFRQLLQRRLLRCPTGGDSR